MPSRHFHFESSNRKTWRDGKDCVLWPINCLLTSRYIRG